MSDIYIPFFPNQPAQQTRRVVYDGDFVRGPEGRQAYQRYGGQPLPDLSDAMFVSRPVGYDAIQIWWGVPPSFGGRATWNTMCVVRSGFGYPVTPSDGEVLLGLEGFRNEEAVPGNVIDKDLPSGRWFYYSLMFRLGSRWVVTSQTQNIVPIDYKHGEAIYSLVPPYHQSQDVQATAGGKSVLREWCDTIGYDLDLTRTLAETVEKIYDTDQSPSQFLARLGKDNLGFSLDEGVGSIRYRSLLAANRTLSEQRGTAEGLSKYIEAVTKYETTAKAGMNELLLPDDGNFLKTTGNWTPLPFGIARPLVATARDSDEGVDSGLPDDLAAGDPPRQEGLRTRGLSMSVLRAQTGDPYEITNNMNLPSNGLMKVEAAEGIDFAFSGSLGQSQVVVDVNPETAEPIHDLVHLNPAWRGVPVEENLVYYLSFWQFRPEDDNESPVFTSFGLCFFQANPSPDGFEGTVGGGSTSTTLVSSDVVPRNPDDFVGRVLKVTDSDLTTSDPLWPGAEGQRRMISGVSGDVPNLTLTVDPPWVVRQVIDDEGDLQPPVELLPMAGDKYLVRTVDQRGFSDAFWGSNAEGAGFATYGEVVPMDFSYNQLITDLSTVSGSWERHIMSIVAPEGARFAVPVVWVHESGARLSNPVRYYTGMMVSKAQGVGIESVYQPNSYFKLINDEGDPITEDDNVLGSDTRFLGEG